MPHRAAEHALILLAELEDLQARADDEIRARVGPAIASGTVFGGDHHIADDMAGVGRKILAPGARVGHPDDGQLPHPAVLPERRNPVCAILLSPLPWDPVDATI